MQNQEIQDWYNSFATKQLKTGVNLRHYHILNKLRALGLKKDANVLEVGCGIGTLTSLLHQYLKKGSLTATDISDESISIAKSWIKNAKSIDFVVTDMTDFKGAKLFDFIVLPDVLEHIPMEDHTNLFATLRKNMNAIGNLVIHIPHPKSIDYIRQNTPEKLQFIDQALPASHILSAAYQNDWILVSYEAYSLLHQENDYVFLHFKPNYPARLTSISKYQIILKKQIARIQYWLGKFI